MDDEVRMLGFMFADRKYDFDISDFRANDTYRIGKGGMYLIDDGKAGVAVVYIDDDKTKADKTVASQMLLMDFKKLILVTDRVKDWQRVIENSIAERIVVSVEIISHRFLMINPTDHYLVPKHVKATEQQRSKLANILSTNGDTIEDNLAQIEIIDPIARWYDFRVGDLIIITRDYPIKENNIYRVVSDVDYQAVTKKYYAILL